MSSDPASFTIEAVRSKDGTTIGYRHYGAGPAVVLVQAAIGTTQSYHEVATNLASDFTVYVPERRGRPLSPCLWEPKHSVEREVEDLEAIFARSGARLLFGLSSGAVIALEATRVLRNVRKLVLYEPPFHVPPRRMNSGLVDRYNREVREGDIAAAMVSALLASGLAPAIVKFVPRPLAEALVALVLRLDDRQKVRTYPPLREVVPSILFDFSVVAAMQGRLETFGSVESDVMLLSCLRSPAYLREACCALDGILPSSCHVEFARLDHSGPWNADRGGKPETVAAAIRDFFVK